MADFPCGRQWSVREGEYEFVDSLERLRENGGVEMFAYIGVLYPGIIFLYEQSSLTTV